jgi:hypothetical protein
LQNIKPDSQGQSSKDNPLNATHDISGPKRGPVTKAYGTPQGLLSIVNTQSLQMVGAVGLHGANRQPQPLGGLLIAETEGIGLQQFSSKGIPHFGRDSSSQAT